MEKPDAFSKVRGAVLGGRQKYRGREHGIFMEKERTEDALRQIGKKAGETVLRLLYPPRCALCDTILTGQESGCCSSCRKKLPWVLQPFCMQCGKPVGGWEREYCDDCMHTRHWYDQGAAAFTYTGAMRRSVYRMKTENRRDYLDFYAEAMAAVLQKHLRSWKPELLLPVPMHWKKRQRRGYNQAELLAKKISGLTGIPMDRKRICCTRAHTAQKQLGRQERMQNLKGSFALKRPVEGLRRVVLIDDVYTTGSTVDALAELLKKAGISQVFFLALCIGKGKKTVCTAENVCYTEVELQPERRGQNEQHSNLAVELSVMVHSTDIFHYHHRCT